MDIEWVAAMEGTAPANCIAWAAAFVDMDLAMGRMGIGLALGIEWAAAALGIPSLLLLLWIGQFPENEEYEL
jgi:hypothetical protein